MKLYEIIFYNKQNSLCCLIKQKNFNFRDLGSQMVYFYICILFFQDNVVYFSYLFEFEMFYKDESYVDENKGNLRYVNEIFMIFICIY